MIARTFHFTRADLLAMSFDELCLVWLPEVERIAREESQ
jgi:hypothetical protein